VDCQLSFNSEIISSIITALATIFAAYIVYRLSKGYYEHSKKIEHDKMMKELFILFNGKYNKIDAQIDDISKMSFEEWNNLDQKIRLEFTHVVYAFFNLCAEEYYWHKEDRISKKVWVSWKKGMNDIYNRSELIKQMWDEECENEGYISYYINKKDEFFKIR
jgi:hypothetical protein